MRGHIRKRERETRRGRMTRWHPIVYMGRDPVTGKKSYREGKGYATRKEAETVLNRLLSELDNGTYVPASTVTLADYIHTLWLPTIKSRIKETTYSGYASAVGRYVVPLLGHLRLQDISPAHINGAYSKMLTGDLPLPPRRTRLERKSRRPHHPRENRPLSPKTVHNTHLLIHKIMGDAMDAGLISRNPATRAKPPRPSKPEITTWTAEQLNAFLRSVEEDPLYGLWHLIAMTGLRRGEALGLRVEDVDFSGQYLAVRQNLVHVESGNVAFTTPKNHRARTISLDPETMGLLRYQKMAVTEERLKWGEGYQDLGLMFPSENGMPRRPDTTSKRFQSAVHRAVANGVVPRGLTLHGLRHTHATIAIAAGVPVKIVSERLGHSSPAFTMAVYQHVLPSMQQEAAAFIAERVRSATREAYGSGASLA